MHRILLIDDEEPFRRMLRIVLSDLGYAVTEAREGGEALTLLRQGSADVVITDLIMPGKEGIETIKELRRDHPQVKIIAMSGGGRLSPANYLHIAQVMGAHRILTKPFSHDELKQVLEDLLAGR